LILHPRGEADFEERGEVLDEEIADDAAKLSRAQGTPARHTHDVVAGVERVHDAGKGAGPADPQAFKLLDERGIGVLGRRLGEVLLWQ
jgi:hypothetical protein